jgi:hypothetical protein
MTNIHPFHSTRTMREFAREADGPVTLVRVYRVSAGKARRIALHILVGASLTTSPSGSCVFPKPESQDGVSLSGKASRAYGVIVFCRLYKKRNLARRFLSCVFDSVCNFS